MQVDQREICCTLGIKSSVAVSYAEHGTEAEENYSQLPDSLGETTLKLLDSTG